MMKMKKTQRISAKYGKLRARHSSDISGIEYTTDVTHSNRKQTGRTDKEKRTASAAKERLKRELYTATEDADRLQDEQMDLESANEQDEERIKVIDEKLEYLRKCAEKHAMEVSKVHMRLSQESQKLEFQEDNQERIRSEIERLSEEFNENQKM